MKKWMFEHKLLLGIGALLLLYSASVLINLGMLELAGEEPRRAMVSLEMFLSGNYIKPTLFGWDYYNKPPLYNWIICASFFLTGATSEFAIRLPSLFFYLLWAAVHYRFSRRYFSKPVALLSAFMLLTSGDVFFYGLANGGEIDIFYSFLVYLQVISIFYFGSRQQWLWLYTASYFLCAVGFLTKGFPSLVFEALTLVALAFYTKSVRPLLRWQHVVGILLLVVLTGAYYYAYSFQGSPWRLLVNLLNESLIKSAVGERSHKLLEKSVGYPVLLLKLLAPWSLLLLLLFKRIRYGLWQNPFVRFSVLFIACNLWVYWLTGQPKSRYIYMFVPFACTVFAQVYLRFTAEFPQQFDRILKYLSVIFLLIAVLLFALPFFAPVSWITTYLLAAGLAAFTLWYVRTPAYRIWLFVAGLIYLRLVYAVIGVPLQYKGIENYQQPLAQAAAKMNAGPLIYWAPPAAFSVSVHNKLVRYQLETVQAPPLIFPQIPYYYYKNTGRLMRYDTALQAGRNYVSFGAHLNEKRIDSLTSFFDEKQHDRIVFYRLQTDSAR